MAREILTSGDIKKFIQSDTSSKLPDGTIYPVTRDGYFDRLFKYIPGELVAGYIFVLGAVKQLKNAGDAVVLHWSMFIVFCILTPLYLWRVQKVVKLQQHIISILSFIIWVFAIGGPFALYSWYDPLYGSILLPVFTLAAAIWEAE